MPDLRIQYRFDTAAAWSAANPVLLVGEIGLDTTNGRIKAGDGVAAWNALGYQSTRILYGAAAPGNGVGVDGDYYITTGAAPVLYGPKAAGAWPAGVSMIGPKGDPGNTGAAATVAVNSTTTGAPGTAAAVTNSGSSSAASLNFTIPRGDVGPQGEKGWSPILAVVADGTRRVFQIVDWAGGAGTKPSVTNQFIGPTGIVATPAEAVDVRGPQGPQGTGGGNEGALPTEYSSTSPPAPTTGLTLFTRYRAKRVPAAVGPDGMAHQFQPALFANRVARVNAIAGATTPATDGIAVTHSNNNTAAPTAVTPANTNFFTSRERYQIGTQALLTTMGSTRGNAGVYQLSTIPNNGGFHVVIRCGPESGPATTRFLLGLTASLAAIGGGTNPSANPNMLCFGADETDANWQFMSNDGSGNALKTDLGANFPRNSFGTNFYEFSIYAPAGSASTVHWAARRLNDGALVQGSRTTKLPAAGVLMTPRVDIFNGASLTAANMHIQSIYCEQDN